MSTLYALSIKQPWAALLVRGLKTIEVRRWPTARRGRILIHAARVPDERPEAWAHVQPELEPLAHRYGGILGSAELSACVPYRSLDTFVADHNYHLNDPGWFQPPVLYGFRFRDPEIVPFRPYSGWMRFFRVEWDAATAGEAPPAP
jgi:ASCH domain